jgi:hypothetical protein
MSAVVKRQQIRLAAEDHPKAADTGVLQENRLSLRMGGT